MTTPGDPQTLPAALGVEWWPEPMESPADRDTLGHYEVDLQVLKRWREARTAYLGARAALVGELERQGCARRTSSHHLPPRMITGQMNR